MGYQAVELTKHYQRGSRIVEALRGVDLTIADGEMLAIQGPTGHGKSTLLYLLGGLDKPTSGSLLFDGEDMSRMSGARLTKLRADKFGFVFQSFNLIPTLTAQENVETALVPQSVPKAERRQRARRALAEVGLESRAEHVPSELSGGEQQRVAIARALVKDPEVIMADEPTGNLDEDTRDEIFGLLQNLWRERGITVILVTHDSTLARQVPRLAHIEHGRLSIVGEGDGGPAVVAPEPAESAASESSPLPRQEPPAESEPPSGP